MIKKNKDSLLKSFTAVYACLFYAHYSLISFNFHPTNLPFIFFGTLFSYDLLQTNKVNLGFFILTTLSSVLLSNDMLMQYALIGVITVLYPRYLRSNLLLKPLAIAISWCLLFKSVNPYLYLEALLFIVALSLPFDLRDKEDDKTIKTLANYMSTQKFKIICMLIWTLFCLLKVINNLDFGGALVVSILSAYYLINLYSLSVQSSRFKTYAFLDFTIALQFFLTYLE